MKDVVPARRQRPAQLDLRSLAQVIVDDDSHGRCRCSTEMSCLFGAQLWL
jgi:hypothetical protein